MESTATVVEYIQSKILKARSKNKKLRVIGANFGINLYDNKLYQDEFNDIKYISLKKYEFKPFLTSENTLYCHPNNTLARCYKAAAKNKRMIYGTPFYYEITIGGAVMNGAIGSHVPGCNVPSYVKTLWIVDGNGINHKIEGEELEYFRSSFGYLGIIYQIELQTFPEQYFRVFKTSCDTPFTHKTHLSQLILHEKAIGVIDEDSDKTNGYEYIDIVLEQVPTPSEKQQFFNKVDMKLQNIAKNGIFLLDGSLSMISKSVITGFFDIFIPKNGSITNSYGLVKAFPIIPKFTLGFIPIPLECGVYIDEKKLSLVLPIILKHYQEWYGKTICGNNFACINIVIRKVIPNNNCALDMTSIKNFNVNSLASPPSELASPPSELVCFDFGFYGSKIHKHLLDNAIRELIPLAFGFHLGKYVNSDIIKFANNVFKPSINKMIEIKNKYDPNHLFSTTNLDILFSP